MSEADATSKTSSEKGKAVQPAKPASKPPRRGGAATLLATLALLVSLATAGAVGYDYWLQQQAPKKAEQPWRAEIDTLKSQLAALEAERAQALDQQRVALEEVLQRHQVNSQSALEEQRQALVSTRARLQRLDEKVQHLASVSREDWLLAEAEYLLRLARHRLALGGEGREAVRALRAAQSNLRAIGDPAIEPVRNAVAADLAALEESNRFDLQGLHAEIAAVAEQAAALQPLAAQQVEAADATATQAMAAQSDAPPLTIDTLWPAVKYALASAAEKLQAYIRVSHRDSEYQRTVIAGGQAQLFAQNLQLLFEQAQWALLAGNAELYRKSLARSEDWLRRYYRLGEAEQAVLDALESLRQRRIRPPQPPLDASLEAVMLYIDGRQRPGAAS